jgi:hypothetical protein
MPDWDIVQKRIHAYCASLWAHLEPIEKIDSQAAANFVKLVSCTPCWDQDPETRRVNNRAMERYENLSEGDNSEASI